MVQQYGYLFFLILTSCNYDPKMLSPENLSSFHNIVYIRDLFNRNVYSYSEFKTSYNLEVLFTTFYGLVDAFPSLWKKKTTITPQNHTNVKELKKTPCLSAGSM